MGWSWKKRKSIIPGVRVNFGKKGISTTLGPRGASVTVGPNGTYLNTSIPGTGLYNRQRIGGSTHSNTSMRRSTRNMGCLESLLTLVSIVLWLAAVGLAIIGCSIYWWLGVILFAVMITTHVVVAKWPLKTRTERKEATPERQTTPSTSPSNSSQINDDFIEEVNFPVTLLMADYYTILKKKNIDSMLNSIGIGYRLNGKDVTDPIEKLNILYWLDMTRCYLGLGNTIDISGKSGLGLFTIITRTLGGEVKSFAHYPLALAVYKDRVEGIVKGMKGLIESNTVPRDEFSVAKLLESDKDLRKSYLVHLYRFASIAAKADNVVTDEEADWLARIMKMQDGTVSNVRIETNDDEDDEPTEKTTTDKPKAKKTPSKSAANELKSLIGLESVKEEVESLTNFIKIQQAREEKGMKTSSVSYHCVFTGNPGTGKTTVARILAKIYKKLGVVTKGHLVETDRAGLVAEYVGQTAVKTNKIIDSALDGVLFIDEAYSLIQGGQSDYGKEAIATLLKRMEDDRDRLIVIIAGYTKEMKDFIDTNPGLQSRFNRYIEFPDYNADELYQIFCSQAKKFEYTISADAVDALKHYLEDQVAHKDKNFGNGRFVRNVFEKTLEHQANRLSREVNLTTDKLSEITVEDLPIQ